MKTMITGLALVIGASGVAMWFASGAEKDMVPTSLGVDVIRNPQGSYCARKMQTACVHANGVVHIPRGVAAETIDAYFSIRSMIPGATELDAMGFNTDDNDRRQFPTREVTGQLSAEETLARMIEGSGLVAKMYDDDWRGLVVVPAIWKEADSGQVLAY